MLKYFKLAPNVHVILNPADRFRTEYNLNFAAAGAFFEKRNEKGVTHLLEHCMVKRTPELSHKELQKLLFKKDIYMNAATSVTYLNLVASGHKYESNTMLEILFQMAFEPFITQEVLDQERQIVLREINERKGNPSYRLSKLIDKKTYQKGSRNLYDVLGKVKDVEHATLEVLSQLHKKMLQRSSIVITGSGGNVDEELIREKFSKYSSLLTPEEALPVNFDLDNKYNDFNYMPVVSKLAHEQVDIEIIIPCSMNMENHPVRVFLYKLLLNPPHGVLYDRLRNDLGHVYHVDGGFYRSTSTLNISATCEISRVRAIINEIKKVFNSYKEAITEEKIQVIKELLVKQQELSQDNPQEAVNFIENRLYDYGTLITLEEFIEQLKRVKSSDIRKLFEELQSNLEQMKVVAVSNNKEIEKIG